MPVCPLTILPVGLDIPASVRGHRFYREALEVSKIMGLGKNINHGGVVGTANTRRAELYGWHNPVSPHMDNAESESYIYGGILSRGKMTRIGCFDHVTGKIWHVEAGSGDVFRLNDRMLHWTEGGGVSLAVFAGEYDEPCDAEALTVLQRGVNRLAAGVRTAPRVSSGFRVPLEDECFATNDFHSIHLVSRKLASSRGWVVAQCANCLNPAVTLDRMWPVDSWGNLCATHVKGESCTAN